MDLNARRKAQQRADRIRCFCEELVELEQEQALALTPEQRAGLNAHLERLRAGLAAQYDVDATESGRRISWGIHLATLLGGAAFCAAFVLFLHRIWGTLPPFVSPFILAAIPLLLLTGTELAFRRGVGTYYTTLLVAAAVVGFVMELNALGNILNLASSPHALLGWGGFAVLAAYAYGLRLPLGAGLLLLCAYTAAVWVSISLASLAIGGYRPN